jgi:hypothetical protein
MRRKWYFVGLLALVVLAGVPLLRRSLSGAQQPRPRASQHGTVSQQIADTTVTIEYDRPVAHGRALFGSLVPWGRVWTPGANYATTIAVNTKVKVNGEELAAGTYSIWAEPQPDRWTIIFSSEHPVFHLYYPQGKDVLRVTATPRTGEDFETLTYYFPIVDAHHAELVIHWGTVEVPVQLDVP